MCHPSVLLALWKQGRRQVCECCVATLWATGSMIVNWLRSTLVLASNLAAVSAGERGWAASAFPWHRQSWQDVWKSEPGKCVPSDISALLSNQMETKANGLWKTLRTGFGAVWSHQHHLYGKQDKIQLWKDLGWSLHPFYSKILFLYNSWAIC